MKTKMQARCAEMHAGMPVVDSVPAAIPEVAAAIYEVTAAISEVPAAISEVAEEPDVGCRVPYISPTIGSNCSVQ